MQQFRAFALFACAAAALVAVAAAGATKPASGTGAGTGTVFLPNPVADLGDQSLTDQKDADYAALGSAYNNVPLSHLDGSGYLRGQWVNVRSETGDPAYSPTNTFRYRRDDDRFEQVMAYYWVTQAQLYMRSLGFGTQAGLRPINAESQDVRINQWGADNSYSWDKHDVLRFGKGGVDDAEDAEVILHEYGHALMDSQQTPFGYGGSAEAGAIGEGFADYFALAVSAWVAPTGDQPCIADWDSVSYTSTVPHCLRRTDTNLTYANLNLNRIHTSGQIWSRALWEIRKELGAAKADTVILEGIFGMRDPTMPEVAQSTVAAADRLYGGATALKVRAQFVERGILA